jgi:hypothetical protein
MPDEHAVPLEQGRPWQIDPHEYVWLTFAGVDERAVVWLNGKLLGQHEGAADPFEFEVTSLLQDRNELVVEVEATAGDGGLYGEVALEVRCTAYLRGIRISATTAGETICLHVEGEVVGPCPGALELYLILDRGTVAYKQVTAALGGQLFQIASEELRIEPGTHYVRVDLVNGSTIWYTYEQQMQL